MLDLALYNPRYSNQSYFNLESDLTVRSTFARIYSEVNRVASRYIKKGGIAPKVLTGMGVAQAATPRFCFSIVKAMVRPVSSMRFENPHSLSYQARTFTNFP